MATDDAPNLRRLARQLVDVTRRLKHLETVPQLAHSSLDDQGMHVYDADGNLSVTLGKQEDGTYSSRPVAGPPPPAPVGLDAEGDAGLVHASWQGAFWAGAAMPRDFEAVEVLVDGNVHGAIHDPEGGSVAVPAFAGEREVSFRTLSQAGRRSDATGHVTVTAQSKASVQLDEARGRIEDAEGDIAGAQARVDTALDAEGHIREDEILRNATLLGDTVVEQINVTDKLIGTDGVFTGTVDFENVNVTGLQLVEKLEAHSISADLIEGGAFTGESFTGGTFIGGEFRTSDTLPGQVTLSDTAAGGSPGIGVTPVNSAGYAALPSVGPAHDGILISGGETQTGGSSFMVAQPLLVAMQAKDADGTRGEISASRNIAQLARTETGGARGEVAVYPGFSLLEYQRDGVTRRLAIDKNGVWVQTNVGGTQKSYNLEETAQDSGWNSFPVKGGITASSDLAWRNKNGVIYFRGTVDTNWVGGQYTEVVTGLPAAMRPTSDMIALSPDSTNVPMVIMMTASGTIRVWKSTSGTRGTWMSMLSYPIG